MIDPILCCLLGLCCPPFSPEQRVIFEGQMEAYFSGDLKKAKVVTDDLYEDFAEFTQKLALKVRKLEEKAERKDT